MYGTYPTPPPPPAVVRKRGWWYGGTLLELVLTNVADLVSGLATLSTHGAVSHDVDELLESAPIDRKLTTFFLILTVGNLVCVYGLWTWKKWGFIGYVLLYLVTIVVAHKLDPADHSVPGIFGLGVLVWMVVNRWRLFE